MVFRKSVAQAWTGTGVQARCQDMTLDYKARQLESNGKINRERQTYLPSNTYLEGKLSSKYYLRFTG